MKSEIIGLIIIIITSVLFVLHEYTNKNLRSTNSSYSTIGKCQEPVKKNNYKGLYLPSFGKHTRVRLPPVPYGKSPYKPNYALVNVIQKNLM
jgi:hypothetical protein